jgi:hypothetical protein
MMTPHLMIPVACQDCSSVESGNYGRIHVLYGQETEPIIDATLKASRERHKDTTSHLKMIERDIFGILTTSSSNNGTHQLRTSSTS